MNTDRKKTATTIEKPKLNKKKNNNKPQKQKHKIKK